MAIVIKTEAQVIKAIHHTENVVELHFKATKRIGNYEPGQFLHLALDAYDPQVNGLSRGFFLLWTRPPEGK